MKRFTKIVTVLFIAISTPFLIADQKEDILKPLDTEGLHFLRKSEPQPDGRIKVGGLVVTKEPGQKYAMVEMARLTNNSYSKENIDIRLIPEIPTGITGPGSQLKYGVSLDNELILFHETNGSLEVMVNSKSEYIVKDEKLSSLKQFIEGGKFVKGISTPDGRIKITKEQCKPVSSGENQKSNLSGMVRIDPIETQLLSASGDKMEIIKSDKPFYLDKYEVTNAQYNEFVKAAGGSLPNFWEGKYPADKADYPVLVNWEQAKAYAKWAGKRLPSFNEWRVAVTDPENRTTLWFKESLMLYYRKFGIKEIGVGTQLYDLASPVGNCEDDKSPYGAYDLLGNVQEWTSTKPALEGLPEGKTAVKLVGYIAQNNGSFNPPVIIYDSCAFTDYDCYGFRCASDTDITMPEIITEEPIQDSLKQPDLILPEYKTELNGNNEVRIKNPNSFSVLAGIRAGEKGKDLEISADSTKSVYVPNGKYEIFFVYSDQPEALFQGDNFTLNNNGIEIQIVKVVNGNYNIKRVK